MSEPRSEAVRAWVAASMVPGTPVRASDSQPSREAIDHARATELAHMRWCAVYGAAVVRAAAEHAAVTRAPATPHEWEAIVTCARQVADATARAWDALESAATGAGG